VFARPVLARLAFASVVFASVIAAAVASAGAAGETWPGRQRRRLPLGTTRAPIATSAVAASAPPVTESATVRVTGFTGCRRGMTTWRGVAAGMKCAGSTAVTACTGLIIPAPVCAPVWPAAVAMIRCTTCAAVSLG
jgi:hypothetical protein